MNEFAKIEMDGYPEHLAGITCQKIAQYSVGLLREHRTIGSGTLVAVGNRRGILTAHHVADILTEAPGIDIGINYQSVPHDFHVSAGDWHLVTIGTPSDLPSRLKEEKYTRCGPDLAFIWITNDNDLTALQKEKTVYPLEENRFQEYCDINPMRLIASGAPGQMKQQWGEYGTPSHRLQSTHFLAQTLRTEVVEHKGFDLWQMATFNGQFDYPSNYKGISGGGLWLPVLAGDPEIGVPSIALHDVVLVGTVFFQIFGTPHMWLVAHGPASIYGNGTLEKIRGFVPL